MRKETINQLIGETAKEAKVREKLELLNTPEVRKALERLFQQAGPEHFVVENYSHGTYSHLHLPWDDNVPIVADLMRIEDVASGKGESTTYTIKIPLERPSSSPLYPSGTVDLPPHNSRRGPDVSYLASSYSRISLSEFTDINWGKPGDPSEKTAVIEQLDITLNRVIELVKPYMDSSAS